MLKSAWGKGHSAERMGQSAWGEGQGAERVALGAEGKGLSEKRKKVGLRVACLGHGAKRRGHSAKRTCD
ncbi:MAG: hypothetical protein GY850_08075 [bacterium]|nr:hypothetical protein [bacterium]